MKKSPNEKFYSFLEKYHIENNMNIQEYVKNIHGDFNSDDSTLLFFYDERNMIEKFLKYFNDGAISKQKMIHFFTDFDKLSEYLLLSVLNAKECRILIFDVIKRNIDAGLLNGKNMMVDLKGIDEYVFQCMSLDEAKKLLLVMNKDILSEKMDKLYDEFTRVKRVELRKFLVDHSIDTSEMVECHRIIYLHYFSKIGKYNDADIEEIINALRLLGISDKLYIPIEKMLNSNYQKRIWSSGNVQLNLNFEKKEKVHYLSDKEYKDVIKELKLYCDLYRNCGIRYLDENEKLYCISLLLKIGKNDEEISQLMQRISWDFPDEMDYSLKKYGEMYFKILYYSEKYHLEENVKNLNDCINAMMITDDMEYLFWKKEFLKELKKVYKKIECDYGYEIENVRVKAKK